MAQTNPTQSNNPQEPQFQDHLSSDAPTQEATPSHLSPSLSPAAVVDTHDTSHTPPNQPVQNASPEVVALRSMFPDYDDAILQTVLESVGGNQDHAIDTLLGMSDPSYKSEAPRNEQPSLSQTELDEQLARRLMLEDQEEQQRQWQSQQQAQAPPLNLQNRPYQARQQQSYQGAPVGGERDTMAEFQDQFNKFAETGKKTIGNLFSKVKSKIQELDQSRSGQGTQPTWGGSGSTSNTNQSTLPQQSSFSSQQYPVSPQPHQPQTAYYDPNPPTIPQSPSPPPPPRTAASNIQGYDVSAGSTTESSTNRLTSQSPSLPSARAPAPIDGGKLGLLPKRPVSLVQDPSATQPQRKPDDDDDDDALEYTENPFEDSRK